MRKPSARPFIAAGLAAALLFGAAACGSDSEGASDKTTTTAAGSDTTAAANTDVPDPITVCSDIPYAPMEFEGEGPRGLAYTGFDIELMDAMAADLGSKLEVIDSDFDGILGNLAAGTCDVVASSLTITPEREKEVDFTEPYFDADQSLLVKTDSGIKGLADLAGKRIGVQTSTTGQTYAEEHKPDGAEVVEFSDTDGMFGALESGDVDAVLQDLPVNAGRVADDDSVEVVETYKTDEQYGFAVEKGSDLKASLDKALKDVRDDGTYDELYAKYFPKAG